MWEICVICALWTQALNAQYAEYMTNNGGGSGSGRNSIKSLTAYPEYSYLSAGNNYTVTTTPQLYTHHTHNTNSRNSYRNTNTNTIPQIANTASIKDFSTKSPLLEATSKITADFLAQSFNAKLFEIMSSKRHHENLVYSPISLQTLLAFIFTMSDGKLYDELSQLLAISNNRTHVAKTFENILQKASLNTTPTTLIIANKLYYDYRFGPVDYSVRSLAKNSFASELEQIDFLASKKAANIINSWVSERTHNLIHDIVTPSSIAEDTSALLLNSIYFKSEWLTKFDIEDTERQDFFITKQIKVPVDMMYNEDVFSYGDFSQDLQASVVELPYNSTDLTMLLILPKDIEGLGELERKLKYYDFKSMSEKLKRETVTVKLPRFKIEYETDMIKPLQQLGLTALFNNVGSINLFKNQQKPLRVDQFKHKSFINVNEAGTEAAATTVAKYIPLSIPLNMKYFVADHPFVFVIRDSNTTFFIGHVAQF